MNLLTIQHYIVLSDCTDKGDQEKIKFNIFFEFRIFPQFIFVPMVMHRVPDVRNNCARSIVDP